MKTKEEIFELIRNILQQNNLSVYQLSKITGINRSTLQKAISGSRTLNLRQFKTLIRYLPLTTQEMASLYSDYTEATWSKEQIISNNCILDILHTITNSLNKSISKTSVPFSVTFPNINSVYSGKIVPDVIKFLVEEDLKNSPLSPP